MRNRLLIIAATALVATALSGLPVAATTPDVAIQEAVTVLPWFEVSVEPGPINYGARNPGVTATSVPGNSAGHIYSNTRVLIGLQGAPFTSGAYSLPADAREIEAWGPIVWPAMTTILNPSITQKTWYPTSAINALPYLYDAPGPCAPAGNWCPFSVSLRITIPLDAMAGAYTSSIEWTFTTP